MGLYKNMCEVWQFVTKFVWVGCHLLVSSVVKVSLLVDGGSVSKKVKGAQR